MGRVAVAWIDGIVAACFAASEKPVSQTKICCTDSLGWILAKPRGTELDRIETAHDDSCIHAQQPGRLGRNPDAQPIFRGFAAELCCASAPDRVTGEHGHGGQLGRMGSALDGQGIGGGRVIESHGAAGPDRITRGPADSGVRA